jgi:CubicO group peptidase (beta-lactamase class C family)
MPHFTRRRFIATTTALYAHPLSAQTSGWEAVAAQAAALEQCRAILVHQGGAPVLSQVFRGPAMGQSVPVKSVSKTLVAALLGAAIDRGEIPSVRTTIAQLTPQLIPTGANARVGALTVENLVTMQAGLERTSGANYGGWVASSDWVRDALERPFVAEPGARMLYSTGSFHVLGAILAEVSGKSLLRLARERLGDPLGIEIPAWTRDPQGRYLGGNEMSLTMPGMIRFGEMYRQGGIYDENAVISASWAQASFEPVTRSPWSGLAYGYGWFLGQSNGASYALARGYGGQIICVVPSLALTLAISSDPTRPARSDGYFGDLMRLVEGAILPEARKSAS